MFCRNSKAICVAPQQGSIPGSTRQRNAEKCIGPQRFRKSYDFAGGRFIRACNARTAEGLGNCNGVGTFFTVSSFYSRKDL